MPIEIAGISLPRIHRIATREQADFISHRIPGLDGNVVQDIGRHSVRLHIEGIFYGANAKDDLESLRDVYKAREPVDFLADIVGQAYFSQIIVETLEVRQAADEPDQISYRLTIAEYVPPPQPAAGLDTPDIDAALQLEALDFLDMIQLPDLLSVPGFGDPTEPLQSILGSVGDTLGSLTEPAGTLSGLFGGDSESGLRSLRSEPGGSSLFDQISANVDAGSILQLIGDQLNTLLSANQSTGNAQQQSAGGIGALQSQVSGLVPPNIDRNNLLQQGFSAISNLLPTDPSSVLGDLSGGLDGLFSSLQTNLVDRLGGILDNFDSLHFLGIGGATSVPQDTGLFAVPPPDISPITVRDRRDVRDLRDVSDLVAEVEKLLQLLPDPLNAKTLLELLSFQLNQLPREQIPLQNLPVLDELRDKLATTLLWLNSDGLIIRDNIAGSTRRLAAYIHELFYENGLAPLKTRLETLGTSVDMITLQTTITAIIDGLNELAARVRANDLNDAGVAIAALNNQIVALRNAGTFISAQWLGDNGTTAFRELSLLQDKLEERMADVLVLTSSSSDLSIVRLAIEPLNSLLDRAGISTFVGGIHELFNAIDSLISQLNLAGIGDTVQDIVDQATGAVQTLQNLLVNATVEFSMLVNRVEQAIADIGINELVAELQGVLNDFKNTVVQGLQTVFQPVRNFLQTAFHEINGFVAAFDPAAILQPVLDLINALTGLLSNPVLIDTIHRIKDILNGVNTELGNFSFRPVTSVVIDGIGVVKDVFGIVARIPMTDSIRQDISEALGAIPESIRPATEAISGALEEIVETGAEPLLEIKDKPAELVEVVLQYSPDTYLGDRLSAPYQDFVSELEKLRPTALMKPVNDALQGILDDIREAADPSKVFDVLQEPFNIMYQALNSIDPQALIQPLQERLSEGIHAVTDRLPLDAADEAFAVVDSIAAEIQKAIDAAHNVRDALISVNARLAGLSDAESQVTQMGNEIVAKLNTVTDFTPISAALSALEQSVDDIQATPLQQYIGDPIEALIGGLIALDAQNRLIALVQAQRGFPRAALDAMADSDQKEALRTLLDGFDPMDNAFTIPLGGLQDRLGDLTVARDNLNAFFLQWQTRYHQPDGPLSQFRRKNMTLDDLKTLLADTVRQQLANTLAPLFKVVENFQLLLSTLLGELIDLIQRLEVQANGLIQINEALEQMRETIHGLVDLLNGLDITFVAREIQKVFDAVKIQLDAINPQHLSDMLKATFDDLLNALDPDVLLGLPALDAEHQELINLLEQRDPKKLVTNLVQPRFDAIIVFLRELDISDILATFVQVTENLKAELETELGRTADAYEDMTRAIPSDFQGSLGAPLSASVST